MTKKNYDTTLIKFAMKFVGILQDYYAERLSVMYILNVNWLYKMMYGMIKPFLAQKTKDKIVILDQPEHLNKFFNEDQLLPEYGGTVPFEYDPYSYFGIMHEEENLNEN